MHRKARKKARENRRVKRSFLAASGTQTDGTNKEETEKKQVIIHAERVTIILGLFAAVYPMVNYFFNHYYQTLCEEFYEIPGHYFSMSINSGLQYIGVLVILVGMPFLWQWYESKRGYTTWSYIKAIVIALFFGLIFGLLNVLYFDAILENQESYVGKLLYIWINKNALITISIVVVISVLGMIIWMLMPAIRKMKSKSGFAIIAALLVFSIIVNIGLLVGGTYYTLRTTPETKREYEIISNENEKYIVLAKMSENVLAIKYECRDDGQYIFLTDEYWILDTTDYIYSCVTMNTKPIVTDKKGLVELLN